MKYLFILLFSFLALSCTRDEPIELPEPPEPKENFVVIEDTNFAVERLRYEFYELSYPDGAGGELSESEPGVALRVMLDGAVVALDLPVRLLGKKIDLADRDYTPDLDGLFFSFYISVNGENGLYCRINSWDNELNQSYGNGPYRGWFSISATDSSGNYVLEWEVRHKISDEVVSVGFIESPFEQI